MTKREKCLVCGHKTYREEEGLYDAEEWGQGKKLTPDEGNCSHCGFIYQEHFDYPFEKQAKKYKEFLKEEEGYIFEDEKTTN